MAIQFDKLDGTVKTATYNGNNITKIVKDGQTVWKQHYDVTYTGPTTITPVLNRSYSEDPYLNRYSKVYPEDYVCIDDIITGIGFIKDVQNVMITNYTFNGVKPTFNYLPTGDINVAVTTSLLSAPNITNYTPSVSGGTIGSITFKNGNNITVRASVWAQNTTTGIGYDITNNNSGGFILLQANASTTQYLTLDSGTWKIVVTFQYTDASGERYESSNYVTVTSTNSDPVLPSPTYLDSPIIEYLNYDSSGMVTVRVQVPYSAYPCTLYIKFVSNRTGATEEKTFSITHPNDPGKRAATVTFNTKAIVDTVVVSVYLKNDYQSSRTITDSATKTAAATQQEERIVEYEDTWGLDKISVIVPAAIIPTAYHKVFISFNTTSGSRTGKLYGGFTTEYYSNYVWDDVLDDDYVATINDNYFDITEEYIDYFSYPSYFHYLSTPNFKFEFTDGKKAKINAKVKYIYEGPETTTQTIWSGYIDSQSTYPDKMVSFNVRELDSESSYFFDGNIFASELGEYILNVTSVKITITPRDSRFNSYFSLYTEKPNGDLDNGLVEGLNVGQTFLGSSTGVYSWEMELLTPWHNNLDFEKSYVKFWLWWPPIKIFKEE